MTGCDDKKDGAGAIVFKEDVVVGAYDEGNDGSDGDLGEDECEMAEKRGTGMDEGALLAGDVDMDDNSSGDRNLRGKKGSDNADDEMLELQGGAKIALDIAV
jgi:hypothetical protein